MKRDGLEIALRAIANQRHHPAAGPGHPARRQRRHGGGAQGGGHCQFGQQQGIAGFHIRQHPKSHHRQQAARRVFRVTVDVLEGVPPAIADGHQLNHAAWRVNGMARRLVKFAPAPVVRLNFGRQACHEKRRPQTPDDALQVFNANVRNHDGSPAFGKCRWPSCRQICFE